MNERIELSDGERMSSAWSKVELHLTNRLDELRRANDSSELTAEQTAAIRGEIRAVKSLMTIGKERPQITQ